MHRFKFFFVLSFLGSLSANAWASVESDACRVETDFESDGKVDRIRFSKFDQGRVVEGFDLEPENGEITEKKVYRYDTAGNLLSWEWVPVEEAQWGHKGRKTEMNYDSANRLVRSVDFEKDDKGDWERAVTFDHRYEAAADGGMTLTVVRTIHRPKDFRYVDTITTYDRQGRVIREIPGLEDDKNETLYVYEKIKDGLRVTKTLDYDRDEPGVDYEVVSTFDSKGRLLTEVQTDPNEKKSERIREIEERKYNSKGKIKESVTRRNQGKGKFEITRRQIYSYAKDGATLLQKVEHFWWDDEWTRKWTHRKETKRYFREDCR